MSQLPRSRSRSRERMSAAGAAGRDLESLYAEAEQAEPDTEPDLEQALSQDSAKTLAFPGKLPAESGTIIVN